MKHIARTSSSTVTPGLSLHPTRKQRLPKRYIAAIILGIILLVSPEIIGQIMVIVYGVLTILRRFSIQQTFIVAAALLLVAPLFSWLTGSEANGSVLAEYSFMLIGVGLIQLILAYRRVAQP